ncbi:hypothetical protein ACFL6Y_09075, partial [Elusimicrobiota bacterium]
MHKAVYPLILSCICVFPRISFCIDDFESTALIGETEVKIRVLDSQDSNPIVYFNMHDDENTAVKAAEKTVREHGGRLVELKHSGKREVAFKIGKKNYSFDPNRIFTEQGLKDKIKPKTKNKEVLSAVRDFAMILIDGESFLKGSRAIVTVHNNTPDKFSIKSFQTGGAYASDAEMAYSNRGRDHDDFFYVNNREIFDYLKGKGYNVLLQDNKRVKNDGSLSAYCRKSFCKDKVCKASCYKDRFVPYVNVEA